MASISDLLIAQGNAAANARSQRGNIYADLIRNLSSLPGQVVQQQRATQQDEMRRQMQQQQIDLSKGEQEIQRQKLAQATRQTQDEATLDTVLGDPTVYDENGMINRQGLQQRLAAANKAHLWPKVAETADRLDESRAQLLSKQQSLQESYRETLGKDALALDQADSDPGVFHLVVTDRARSGVLSKDQADALLKVSTPEEVKSVTARWKAGSAAGKPKLMKLGEGDVLVDENTGKPLYSAPAKPLAPSAASFAATANDPTKSEAERASAKNALTSLQDTPASVETARHNLEMEKIGRMTAGRQDARDAEIARHDRAMEETARNRTTARPVLSGDVNRIADIDTSLNEITALRDEVKNTGTGSYIGAHLWNPITDVTGIGAESKKRQSQIDRTKQLIGKTLEGGVLRKEDELKYEKILPTIGDPPEVAARKLDGLERMMKQKRETIIETLDDAGFNVEAMKKRGPAGGAKTEGRVRVVGPNGQTGTVPAGTTLPDGWKFQ